MSAGQLVMRLAAIALSLLTETVHARTTNSEPGSIETAATISMAELQSYMMSYLAKLPGIRSVKRKGPETIAVTNNKGEDVDVYLGNLLDTLNTNKRDRVSAIENFAAAITAPRSVAEEPKDTAAFSELLLPGIRDAEYVKRSEELFASKGDKNPPLLIKKELVPGLLVLVTVDSPKSMRFLTTKDVAERKLDPADAFARAVHNLSEKLNQVRIEMVGPLHAVMLDTNYEVSLLTVAPFWQKIEKDLGSPVAVAIPARGALIYAPLNNQEAMAALTRLAQSINMPYPITRRLLKRSGDGWAYID